MAHGFIALLLVALIVLHIAAALYHQVVLKDGLMRRMWFGRRNP
ncbi:MAG: cytochrome b/b6 domain-containing protein [Pseudomonadota bacterium]